MQLTPSERIVAWRLSSGRIVSKDELVNAIWGNDNSGGPNTSYDIVRKAVSEIRIKIGVNVETYYYIGYLIPKHNLIKFQDLLIIELLKYENKSQTHMLNYWANKRKKEPYGD